MEIPALIRQRLGDEELDSAVNLGDEDLICFTPTRTLLYRGEGLLSDDSIEVYEHDVDRLDVSEGRRKAAFTLTYFDREERFTVSRDRTDAVLERLLTGVLRVAEVIDDDESVDGVFQFSELTLIVTDARIVKHVGTYLWDADYEEYPFANVTGLEFEEGSVATYIVVSVDGRPQRIKAPRQDAELVKRALVGALCSYYEVDSIEQLNDVIGGAEPDTDDRSSDIELDDSIAPLVTPDEEEDEKAGTLSPVDDDDTIATVSPEVEEKAGAVTDTGDDRRGAADDSRGQRSSGSSDDADTPPAPDPGIDPEDVEVMKSRLATLTKVVKRQNRLLKRQQETIDQLAEEIGRQK